MAKIYLKIALMIVLTLVWCLVVSCADAIMESGHWFLLMCMVIFPIVLFAFACRSGRMDDVLEWFEKIERKIKTY
jgi:FtsH-binding integral membrane protein